MTSPKLTLPLWSGAAPNLEAFPGDGPVLWVGSGACSGWLDGLRGELDQAGRLFAPALTAVQVPRARLDSRPWAFRPDDHASLRWGDPAADVREIARVPGCPESFGGLVLEHSLGSLASHPARALMSQAAERLAPDSPWLLVDRNGRYLPQVVRSLRQPESERGEGRGTWRTAEELRRLVEVVGLGITGSFSLPEVGKRGRLARLALGGTGGAAWLALLGRRARSSRTSSEEESG